jgi:hypothetical protein
MRAKESNSRTIRHLLEDLVERGGAVFAFFPFLKLLFQQHQGGLDGKFLDEQIQLRQLAFFFEDAVLQRYCECNNKCPAARWGIDRL